MYFETVDWATSKPSISSSPWMIEHCQKISSAHGLALLNDVLCDVLRRTGDELVITEREPPGGRRRVGHVRIEALVLGHKALQANGYALRIEARLVAGRCHSHTPS